MTEWKELEGYYGIQEIPVLWGDMDSFSHVNNARYFTWMETSRIAYLHRAGMGESMLEKGWGPILAAVNCNYRRQVRYPDTIFVGARVQNIGRSSILVEHRFVSQEANALCADGESKIVMFDYNAQRPIRVTDEVRAAIADMQS